MIVICQCKFIDVGRARGCASVGVRSMYILLNFDVNLKLP